MGLQGIYPLTVFNYAEPTTTTAQYSGQSSVTIPANTTGNVVSCATLFPGNAAPICVSVQDVTSGGVALSLGLDSSGTRIPMAANGFQLFRTAGTSGSQIVFYVDNNTATDASLQVTELSN